MIHNVEIIKADWKNDLGRGSNSFGLQLVIQAPDDEWKSCAEFGQEAGQRVLGGFGVSSTQELEGKWCVVEAGIGASEVRYLGPFSQPAI